MRAAAKTEVGLSAAAALGTVGAWVYTIHSADSMSSAMPMPGGWSMSMAWMSMGGQSSLAMPRCSSSCGPTMMIAMMLPSVMPTVLLHRRVITAD